MKKWHVSLENGVALVRFQPGIEITIPMVKAVFRELHDRGEKYRAANAVIDVRNTVPDRRYGFDAMAALVEGFREGKEIWWHHQKSAMLVNNPVSFGMARMWATLMDGWQGLRVRVFNDDPEAALAWARL